VLTAARVPTPFSFVQPEETADLQPIIDKACRDHIDLEFGNYAKVEECAQSQLSDPQLYAFADELRVLHGLPRLLGNPELIKHYLMSFVYAACLLRIEPCLDSPEVLSRPKRPHSTTNPFLFPFLPAMLTVAPLCHRRSCSRERRIPISTACPRTKRA
jgi:hypothetical protein